MVSTLLRGARRWYAALGLALFATGHVHAAVDYTDLWWAPAESGWGVNFVQSNQFLFGTFFIYDGSKQSTWVSAELRPLPSSTAWSGDVYRTEGTSVFVPWNGARDLKATKVGSITFTPSSLGDATVTYKIGPDTVTRTITRQTLTPGYYFGAYFGYTQVKAAACGLNPPVTLTRASQLDVEVYSDGSMSLRLLANDPGNGGTEMFRIAGNRVEQGRTSTMTQATMTVPGDPQVYTISSTQVLRTAQGMEVRVQATFAGCDSVVTFAGVRD